MLLALILGCVCVCLCVFIPFILDVRHVDVPAAVTHKRKVTHDFSTFLLRCLHSFFLREGFSRSFPSSTVMPNFVYTNELVILHYLLGIFCILFIYFLCEEKSQFA